MLEFAYPERHRVARAVPPWYPLPDRQAISEAGTFLVRGLVARGVSPRRSTP